MKKLLALLLAAVMVLGMVACTKTPATTTTAGSSKDTTAAPAGKDTTAAPVDTTTGGDEVPYLGQVEVFNGEAANAGLCTGWMPDYIREKAGVDMMGIPIENGLFENYLAGGSLPDVSVVQGLENFALAIEGGYIIDLDTVKDKLPNVFDKYYDANKGMVQYVRDNLSNGTGGVYGLGRMFTSTEIPDMDIGGIFLRYDVYGQLGYPEINSLDDLLQVLKDMQAAYPETEDGHKVYAISTYATAKGLATGWGYVARGMGYSSGLAERDYSEYKKTGDYKDLIWRTCVDDESGYKKYLQFLFEANQAGLMDPNTLTQSHDDSKANVQNGYALLQWDNWGTTWSAEQQTAGQGFCRVNIGTIVGEDLTPVPAGGDSFITISSTCKNLDAACALINFMYDPAFTISYMNGPQGQVWDYDEDGTPMFLEGGYEKMLGLDFSNRGCIIMLTYHFSGALPGCNGCSSDYNTWPTTADIVELSTLQKNWRENTTNGHSTLYAAEKEKGNTVVPPASKNISLTDDLKVTKDRIEDRIGTGSWECILAADQAAFDAAWASMKSDVEGMGIQDIFDYWVEQYNKGCEEIAPYLG